MGRRAGSTPRDPLTDAEATPTPGPKEPVTARLMTVDYLADHTLLLALPAFAPAVVVVGVVVYVAMRDRRNARRR